MRAIEEVGKVEVLSRPTILARNNQQATVVVGQQVPIITSVTYDTFGNEHSAITYQNVGVILQVTPFITPDNMVEMILAPQISQRRPLNPPVISSGTNGSYQHALHQHRSANTVVVTPDGQTVVIGGMMQDSKTSTDSKIPLLGDIPGLGLLFHHKVKSVAKTELIILLTPYVVRTPEDLARMTRTKKAAAGIGAQGLSAEGIEPIPGPRSRPPPGAAPPSAARMRAAITIIDT